MSIIEFGSIRDAYIDSTTKESAYRKGRQILHCWKLAACCTDSKRILQENILEDKQNSEDIHQRRNLLGLAGAQIQHHIGDNTQADALGDAVEQRHRNDGDVGRDGLGEVIIVEADLGDGADHQESHHNQRGSGGEGGNGGEERSENGVEQEQQTSHHSSQTGAAAGSHTGGGFHKGGDGGGTTASAAGS